jgi:hypothetical protein
VKVKLIQAVVIVCSIIGISLAGNSLEVAAQPQDNFVTFGKSIFGVSIKHPADWQVEDYDRRLRDDRVGYDSIATMCPKSVLEHPYRDSNITRCPEGKQVYLAVRNLPQNSSMEEILNYLNTAGRFEFTGYKVGDISNTSMAGSPAKKSTYTYLGEYNASDEIIKVLEILTIHGNRAYVVSYFSPQLEFDDLMPVVQKMIDSFKIMPMSPCNFVKDDYGGKCILSGSSSQ